LTLHVARGILRKPHRRYLLDSYKYVMIALSVILIVLGFLLIGRSITEQGGFELTTGTLLGIAIIVYGILRLFIMLKWRSGRR